MSSAAAGMVVELRFTGDGVLESFDFMWDPP